MVINVGQYSDSTSKGAPVSAMGSTLYDWDARNIAKINPKNGQKTVSIRLCSNFLENCPYDSSEILYNQSTPF